MRTMVRVRGDVRNRAAGSEVSLRFRPHWEAVAWSAFGGLMAIAGSTVLVATLLTGTGPVLWPLATVALFGAFTWQRVQRLRVAKHELESGVLAALADRVAGDHPGPE